MIAGVTYTRVDDIGLHIEVNGEPVTLEVDHVIVCAGQEPRRELFEPLTSAGFSPRLIGGADVAAELDAKAAIRQGVMLAATI